MRIVSVIALLAVFLMLPACAGRVSEATLSDEGKAFVEQGGPSTNKNSATYSDDRWTLISNGDAHIVDNTKGASVIQGTGPFRAFRVDGKELGSLSLYGQDDLSIGEISYQLTDAGKPKLTIRDVGGVASTVLREITAQLAHVFGPAWTALTAAEQAVLIEKVRAQVALGESIADAVASVAAKALTPAPIP